MTQCIPKATGVPGLWSQPPTWPGIESQTSLMAWQTTTPPSTSVPQGLDDPRWQGAARIGHPAAVGAGEDATFRALYHEAGGQKSLFLSWHVRADSAPNPGLDVIWVGFERASGDPLLINIEPFSSGATKLSESVAAVGVYTLNAGSNTATPWPGSLPDWIQLNTRAWFHNGTSRWAVQMRVPIRSDQNLGVNLANTFRMWYEVTVVCPGATCIPHRWPYTAGVVTESEVFPFPLQFPILTTWDTFHLSTGSADPVCPTTGFVSLSLTDVGTTRSPSSGISLTSENTFEAKPLNKTGAAIPAHAISAFFRMANWGSIANPNAPWDPIPASVPTTNPATNTGEIADGAQGVNTFKWTLSSPERDQFKPTGTKDRHQCILVELSGGGLVFMPSSVWRNMDFVTASRFKRVAEISSVGLGAAPAGAPARDTYLLVEKLNMPEKTSGEEPPAPKSPIEGRWLGEAGGADHDEQEVDPLEALTAAANRLMTTEERLDASKPTYRVHVYHDTGQTVVRKGTTLRVLTPGTSFGYYVEHERKVAGWDDQIIGAIEIAPNFYKLSVPAEGVAHITTVVVAHERPRGPIGWLKWLFELLRRLWRSLLRLVKRLLGRGP